MSTGCKGKDSWPELVGVKGEVAAATVEKDNPHVHAVIVPEGTIVTQEFRCDRVRVWINADDVVYQVPTIG